MSRTNRSLGLARSLLMYHAIPGRQRRLRRLYRHFVTGGDLVFDLGAHVGNRTRAFRALGCRVVALDPQPDCIRILRTIFGRSGEVDVVASAVSATGGEVELSISERYPTLTTVDPDWRDARARDPLFHAVRWNRRVAVAATTLDALVARYGRPAFVKIDVEGAEPQVLQGLSHPLPALSFEYLPGSLERVDACLARLSELGRYRFTWSPGETYEFADAGWMTGARLQAALTTATARRRSGDIYARLESG